MARQSSVHVALGPARLDRRLCGPVWWRHPITVISGNNSSDGTPRLHCTFWCARPGYSTLRRGPTVTPTLPSTHIFRLLFNTKTIQHLHKNFREKLRNSVSFKPALDTKPEFIPSYETAHCTKQRALRPGCPLLSFLVKGNLPEPNSTSKKRCTRKLKNTA